MKEMEQTEKEISEINRLIQCGKHQEAISHADQAISAFQEPGFGEDRCFSFESKEQFIFFCARLQEDEQHEPAIWSAGGEASILMLKAYALHELKKHQEAIETLLLALEYNPVSTAIRFELIENHFQLRQYGQVQKYLRELEHLVIYPNEIAQYYRRYGFLLTELHKYEQAIACYLYSMNLERSAHAENEVAYILEACMKVTLPKGKAIIQSMRGTELIRILKKHGLFLSIEDDRRKIIANGEHGQELFNAYRVLQIIKQPTYLAQNCFPS